jgi:hypothetical protein
MQCQALCLLISSWLTSHGYGLSQRDAVLQNIHLESRFQPCVTRGRNGSAYLLQWLGPRRRALEAWSNDSRCPGWTTQMEFMTSELQGRKFRRFWLATTAPIAFYEFREHFGRGR